MTEKAELSPREREILALVAQGMTNREIAQKLSISPNTVKVHLSNIFEKTGAASRTEATLYGIEYGLVEVPGNPPTQENALASGLDVLRQFLWVWVPLAALFLLIVMTIVTNVFVPSPAAEPEPLQPLINLERWQTLSPLPEPRNNAAASSYDGDIFVIGGEDNAEVYGSVFRYDTELDNWEKLADKPLPVAEVRSVLVGEKIYVPGGRMLEGLPTNQLEIYDPRLDEWTEGAPLPKAVCNYGLVNYEGRIYLFGGWDGNHVLKEVFVYDPITDAWSEGTNMPDPKIGVRAAEVNGKIYLAGGKDGTRVLKTIQVYNPSREDSTETPWLNLSPLEENFINLDLEDIGNLLFMVVQSENHQLRIYSYLSETDEWVPSPEMLLISTNSFMVSALDDYLYINGIYSAMDGGESFALKYKALYINLLPSIEY